MNIAVIKLSSPLSTDSLSRPSCLFPVAPDSKDFADSVSRGYKVFQGAEVKGARDGKKTRFDLRYSEFFLEGGCTRLKWGLQRCAMENDAGERGAVACARPKERAMRPCPVSFS